MSGSLAPGNGRERVFLSLGSNVGRRPDRLRKALRLIRLLPGTRVVRVSRLYTTSPVGYTEQRDFLNGIVELRTRLAPDDLLERTRGIEAELGKATPFRNGPRAIDIDLALYGSRVIRGRDLAVPHPRLHLRRFVLAPLAEVAPRLLHPVERRSVSRLLAGLGREGRVSPWGAWEPVMRRTGGMGTR